MKRVIRLVNIQLWAVLGDMLSVGKSKKKNSKVLYGGVLFFTLVMGSVSLFYSFMMGTGLKLYNSLDLLPAIMMSVTCLIILFTTIFKVKGTIFGFRDYDMVMSLPISTEVVVASRLFILYAFNFLFVIIMIVPMMIAYGFLARPGFQFYVIGFILMFIIPLVPIVIASVLGTIIAYIASKFRRSNVLNIILTIGLFMGIFVLSFTMRGDAQQFVDIGKALTNQVNGIYPLAQMYTDSVVEYDLLSLAWFIVISLLAFLLYTFVVKLSFKKINTLIMTGSYRSNFKMGALKSASPFKALYRKELRRYFSSTLYVLNTGIGIVMLTVGAVAALFVDPGKALGNPDAAALLMEYVPVFITFCIIMTCPAMASISLEGKSLWILKSMPVTPKTVYLSKAAVSLTIIAPALIDILIIGVGLKYGVVKTLIMLLVGIACVIFISLYGLLINIIFPNFNWTSEIVVIKQSAACMITVFSGIAYAGLQILFLLFLPSFTFAYLVYFLLTAAIDIALYMLIMNYGVKRYYSF